MTLKINLTLALSTQPCCFNSICRSSLSNVSPCLLWRFYTLKAATSRFAFLPKVSAFDPPAHRNRGRSSRKHCGHGFPKGPKTTTSRTHCVFSTRCCERSVLSISVHIRISNYEKDTVVFYLKTVYLYTSFIDRHDRRQ